MRLADFLGKNDPIISVVRLAVARNFGLTLFHQVVVHQAQAVKTKIPATIKEINIEQGIKDLRYVADG
jgi:hypothetical protein